MREMWPCRVDSDVKKAFEDAASRAGIKTSRLMRAAFQEYIDNNPDLFFNPGAQNSTASPEFIPHEVAQ